MNLQNFVRQVRVVKQRITSRICAPPPGWGFYFVFGLKSCISSVEIFITYALLPSYSSKKR